MTRVKVTSKTCDPLNFVLIVSFLLDCVAEARRQAFTEERPGHHRRQPRRSEVSRSDIHKPDKLHISIHLGSMIIKRITVISGLRYGGKRLCSMRI